MKLTEAPALSRETHVSVKSVATENRLTPDYTREKEMSAASLKVEWIGASMSSSAFRKMASTARLHVKR